jgi:hypothetical protein
MDRPSDNGQTFWSTDRPWSTDRLLVDRQTFGQQTDTRSTDRRGLWTDLRAMNRCGLWTDLWQRTDAVYGQTFAQRTDRGTPNSIDHKVHQEADLTMAMAELAMASHP